MNWFGSQHVGCSYGSANVIDDVTFTVTQGEFVGIVGPSGGGKTTVAASDARHARSRRSGGSSAVVMSASATSLRSRPSIGAFRSRLRDVVHMTMPRPRFGRLSGRDAGRAAHMLERLGIAEYAGRQISALSGGQQQRVFLARALVHDPDVLVLDEPAGGVDVATRHEILHLLADLHHDGMSIVLTTHDINGLAAHLPRLVCFNRTVVADGPPADVLHPYVLERTYGAPMSVLQHGGMPVVLEASHGLHACLQSRA